MRSGWSLLGVALAANALLTAPFAHLHRPGFEHDSAVLHWHVAPSPSHTQLHSSGDADGAVELDVTAEAQPEAPVVALVEVFDSVAPRAYATHPAPAPEFRSHDPPPGPPSSPRAPPV